jgi:hypothetical protein
MISMRVLMLLTERMNIIFPLKKSVYGRIGVAALEKTFGCRK